MIPNFTFTNVTVKNAFIQVLTLAEETESKEESQIEDLDLYKNRIAMKAAHKAFGKF